VPRRTRERWIALAVERAPIHVRDDHLGAQAIPRFLLLHDLEFLQDHRLESARKVPDGLLPIPADRGNLEARTPRFSRYAAQAFAMGHHHEHRVENGHHAHEHDRGVRGFVRYLRLLPHMWTSDVNREVVRSVAPVSGEWVVDLGAGMGAGTVEAAMSGAAVVAVDPTPYMRRILALRRRWQRHRATIRIVDGAAESIPLADGSVDALWTVNTIHHWTERDQASRELARVMKPGGRVLLVDEDFDDPSHPSHARFCGRRARHGHTFEDVDPDVVAASLRGAGFSNARGSRTTIAGRPVKLVRATR
jgi:SAM-dependent methyltransferase